MQLKIMTPTKLIEEREIYSVTLNSRMGQMTIMDGHDMVATLLDPGELFFRTSPESAVIKYKTGSGGAEITSDSVLVFLEEASKIN